ncbi:MAG: hypothetical protein HJJLKODD_02411 [Phycisphaerae bacterium]|nr:hypothetical protein [Phycisphaerae bacterium]
MKWNFLCCWILLWSGLVSGCAQLSTEPVNSPPGITTRVIIIRHAERDPVEPAPNDLPLNEEGLARAEVLRDLLAEEGITAIYSPDLTRNLQTVEPLAELLGIEVTVISQIETVDTKALANSLVEKWTTTEAGGVILFVGNTGPVIENVQSGNLQELYSRLGGDDDDPPTSYNDIYYVTIPDEGPVVFDKQTYSPE